MFSDIYSLSASSQWRGMTPVVATNRERSRAEYLGRDAAVRYVLLDTGVTAQGFCAMDTAVEARPYHVVVPELAM